MREGDLQKSDGGRLPRPWRDGFASLTGLPREGRVLRSRSEPTKIRPPLCVITYPEFLNFDFFVFNRV